MRTIDSSSGPPPAECTQGLVSVMMPAYNAARFITRAIESLREQTYDAWELLVIDDGSTDGTGELAGATGDARVAVFRQENRGEAESRNAALSVARGEFVAFLDADDAFLPDHLETAVGYLREHPAAAGVCTDGFYVTADERRIQTLSSRRVRVDGGSVFDELVRSSAAIGPPVCVVLRLAPVRARCLGFDAAITIGPDWDFFTRFAESEAIGRIDRATCLYRLHGTNITTRTATEIRRRDLATCRSKAINLRGFGACPADVRVAAYYDLLVNALLGAAERQEDATRWDAFGGLPAHEQARLLRVMASKTIIAGGDRAAARRWLERSVATNPRDGRTRVLLALETASPRLCRRLLRLRGAREIRAAGRFEPFADIVMPTSGAPR